MPPQLPPLNVPGSSPTLTMRTWAPRHSLWSPHDKGSELWRAERHGKIWFCYDNKIRGNKYFFLLLQPKILLLQPNFWVDRTKHFVLVTKYFYLYFNKWFCWYNKTFYTVNSHTTGCDSLYTLYCKHRDLMRTITEKMVLLRQQN